MNNGRCELVNEDCKFTEIEPTSTNGTQWTFKKNINLNSATQLKQSIPQIQQSIYTGYCHGNPPTIQEASVKDKGRDITNQLQNAIKYSMKNGGTSKSISCIGDKFECDPNSNYKGSYKFWDNKDVGLGPEECPGKYQYILTKCKNGNFVKSNWGSPIDLSKCV